MSEVPHHFWSAAQVPSLAHVPGYLFDHQFEHQFDDESDCRGAAHNANLYTQ